MAVTNTVGGGVPGAPEKKRQQEKATVGLMIELYCRGHHGTPKGRLCPDCAVLRDYADARVDHCPHIATKTFCSVCQTHCYKPEMRERIRQVMRWSGPRMLFHHPFWRCGIWQRRGSRKRGNKILNMPEGERGPSGFFAVCRSRACPALGLPASAALQVAAGGHAPPYRVDSVSVHHCQASAVMLSQFVQSCTIQVSNNYLLFTNLFG